MTPEQLSEWSSEAKAFLTSGSESFAESAEAEDFSPAGADGQRAINLLQNVRADARAAFVESCRTAIERLVATGEPFQQGTLFSDEELAVVADSLSRSIAVGDLLGRVRIRRRAERAQKVQPFAEWRGPFEGERGGRYWLADGAQDTPENRRYENPNESGGDGGAIPEEQKATSRLKAISEAADKVEFLPQKSPEEWKPGTAENAWLRDGDGGFIMWFTNRANGQKYEMNATKDDLPLPGYVVDFQDGGGSYKAAGQGGAAEVFTIVNTAVAGLLRKKSPQAITFTAEEPSRQKLYDRLAKTVPMIVPEYVAVAYAGTKSQSKQKKRFYILAKREHLEKIKQFVVEEELDVPEVLAHSESELYEMFAELDFESFADDDDPYHDFAEPVPNLEPTRAVDYFRKLVPSLGGSSARYGPRLDRHSFTLAVASDQVILDRVKAAILRSLQSGDTNAGIVVEDILDEAGVSPRNPQYADMVVRTNIMDAYNQGAQDELAEPDMQEAFPVWEYLGVLDSRTGEDHAPMIGKYYPSSVPFAEVRGGRVFNCRCSFAPVSRFMSGNLKIEEEW